MLQVLSEMICTEELFRLVALAKLMGVIKMLCSRIPVRRVGKLFAAEATKVGCSWSGVIGMKRSVDASERSARPRMSSQMQRILMALSLIFVFEPIRAILTDVLLF